jgi:beta-aspartyl-dipeptidase (metallo-type)
MTVIHNAKVYAPQPLGRKSLLIGGGQILAISNEPIELPDTLGVEVIDLQGQRLLPGYIDSHAHITGGGGEAGFATQVPPVPISQFTNAGVTTVVGLLGTDDLTRSTGNVLARVYGLREEGLSAYCWTGGYHLPLTTLTGTAKSDIVYLEPVIGVGEFAISDHRSSQPMFEEVIRLASEAHVAGLMTGKAGIIHFHLGDGERKLELIKRAIAETEIPARVFNPTHVNRNKPLFDQACELMSLGIYADITAFPKGTAAPGYEAAEAIALAIERKVPLSQLTLSSDGGGCLPCFDAKGELTSMDFGRAATLHETVLELLADDLDLATILPMLTANVADLLRLHHKGRIKVGNDADLLVLNNSNEISCVMAQGRWHKRLGKQLVKGTFE